jgi:hypothetical protein
MKFLTENGVSNPVRSMAEGISLRSVYMWTNRPDEDVGACQILRSVTRNAQWAKSRTLSGSRVRFIMLLQGDRYGVLVSLTHLICLFQDFVRPDDPRCYSGSRAVNCKHGRVTCSFDGFRSNYSGGACKHEPGCIFLSVQLVPMVSGSSIQVGLLKNAVAL